MFHHSRIHPAGATSFLAAEVRRQRHRTTGATVMSLQEPRSSEPCVVHIHEAMIRPTCPRERHVSVSLQKFICPHLGAGVSKRTQLEHSNDLIVGFFMMDMARKGHE